VVTLFSCWQCQPVESCVALRAHDVTFWVPPCVSPGCIQPREGERESGVRLAPSAGCVGVSSWRNPLSAPSPRHSRRG
jgi:hypothetical protein